MTKRLPQEKYQLYILLPDGYTTYIGRCLQMFLYNLRLLSSVYDCLTLEDGNNSLSWLETTIRVPFITTRKRGNLIYIATKALNL